ncbi:MAG: glycosyltransferase family 4 protein [Chlamydiae bacterium]|nr:glycosyltransferase family 4 protein [Chlamydiota bacterium]MBI3277301.1 glycosyltransferase family 4 protein [Chlamydiota bacterium]
MTKNFTRDRKKVCFFTTDSSWGGAEKIVCGLIRRLSRKTYDISLVTLKGDDRLIERVKPFCERTLNLRVRGIFDLRAFFRLVQFLKEGQFHIFHLFLFHANLIGRILGRLLRIPVIVAAQQSMDVWRRYPHVLLDRWTSHLCDAIISFAQIGKERLVAVEKISPEKIHVIYNSLNLEEVPKKLEAGGMELEKKEKMCDGRGAREERRGEKDARFRAASQKSLGISSNAVVVGMVANFRKMKGHRYFIEAADILLKERKDFYFVIAGEGKDREKYELEVKKRGITGRFRFLGFVANIYEALALMDIFVLPSEWEGLPLSILEAMAFGVPVIATNVGGVPEVIEHEKTGLLISPRDPIAIRDAVLKILNHPEKTQKMVEAGCCQIQQNFSEEKMIRQTLEIYEDLLGRKKFFFRTT